MFSQQTKHHRDSSQSKGGHAPPPPSDTDQVPQYTTFYMFIRTDNNNTSTLVKKQVNNHALYVSSAVGLWLRLADSRAPLLPQHPAQELNTHTVPSTPQQAAPPFTLMQAADWIAEKPDCGKQRCMIILHCDI